MFSLTQIEKDLQAKTSTKGKERGPFEERQLRPYSL